MTQLSYIDVRPSEDYHYEVLVNDPARDETIQLRTLFARDVVWLALTLGASEIMVSSDMPSTWLKELQAALKQSNADLIVKLLAENSMRF